MQEEIQKFEKDELVLAKIRGYPWWPALVAKVLSPKQDDEQKYLVNFIGDNSHSTLPGQYMAKYDDSIINQLVKNKSKKLQDSLEIANKIKNGKTSYEKEVRKLEQKKMMQKIVFKSKQLQESSKKKKRKDDSDKKSKDYSLNAEIETKKLLDIVSQPIFDYSEIESQLKNVKKSIEYKNPTPDNIEEILESHIGQNLSKIQHILENKKGCERILDELNQQITTLKQILLKLYFHPGEIIQQLDSVYQGEGHKKLQKLFEKVWEQEDWIHDDDEEDESDESDSIDKKNHKILPIKQRVNNLRKLETQFGNLNSTQIQLNEEKKRLKKMDESSNSEAQVPNPKLRKKVCHQILTKLENCYEIQKDLGKNLSVKIEQYIRKEDPKMEKIYKQLFFVVCKNLEVNQCIERFLAIQRSAGDYNRGTRRLKRRFLKNLGQDIFQFDH